MAGRKRGPVAERQREREKRRTKNRWRYQQLVRDANLTGMSSSEIKGSMLELQREIIGRAVAHMRYAAAQVDSVPESEFWVSKVDAQGNVLVEPNKWYQLEQACREEVSDLLETAQRLGLSEKMVAIEYAKAELIYRVVLEAARGIGIPQSKVRKLGPAIRSRLEAAA